MDKITYAKAKKQYGTVTLKGLTVALTDNAQVDNCGTNPTRVCYYAPAIDRAGRRRSSTVRHFAGKVFAGLWR